MNWAPPATATARAERASVRSMLTPTGTGVAWHTKSTARVMAATVSGSTRPMRKGESPKFSTIMPLAPPSVRVAASRFACSSTADRSPPHLGEPGRGGRWITPINALPSPNSDCMALHLFSYASLGRRLDLILLYSFLLWYLLLCLGFSSGSRAKLNSGKGRFSGSATSPGWDLLTAMSHWM